MDTRNELKLAGKLVGLVVEETKNGKEVVRLLVEVDPPSWAKNAEMERVPVDAFGYAAKDAKKLSEGALVAISGRIRGREYNGKHYSNCVADKVEMVAAPVADEPAGEEEASDNVPF